MDAEAWNLRKWQRLTTECNQVIHAHHPEATVFFNGGASLYHPEHHGGHTHSELEDLPTTWGGYNKFPIRAKFFADKGKDFLAMSGKFHTMWGEFGGFKHPDAIRYEAAAMIAFGARCSFGDQAHPSGEIDMATYRNIGCAYKYVEQIEEYGLDGQPCSNLGVWLSGDEPHDQGVADMLLETQTDFAVVDPKESLAGFETIILTGKACLNAESAIKLNAYVKAGGRLLVLGEGALDNQRRNLVLDVGARYVGPARYENDYLVVGKELSDGMVESPFLNYTAGLRVRLTGAKPLAAIREPYFNRTYATYCSHQNTPYRLQDAPQPGAWRTQNVVCLPHALGELYYRHGARLHRQLFVNALRLLHRRPVLAVQMPSAGRVNLVHQPARKRYVVHLLYGPPLQRGRCLVIEDLVPLFDVPVALRVPQRIKNAYLAPQRVGLGMARKAGETRVVVPELQCHQAAVFEY